MTTSIKATIILRKTMYIGTCYEKILTPFGQAMCREKCETSNNFVAAQVESIVNCF